MRGRKLGRRVYKGDDYVELELRVRYAETDLMGVVYYANYLVWFEMGRSEYCRQRGFNYLELEELGYRLVVVEAYCTRTWKPVAEPRVGCGECHKPPPP